MAFIQTPWLILLPELHHDKQRKLSHISFPMGVYVGYEGITVCPEGRYVSHGGQILALEDPDLLANWDLVSNTVEMVLGHFITKPEGKIWTVTIKPDLIPFDVVYQGRRFLAPSRSFIVNSVCEPYRSPF